MNRRKGVIACLAGLAASLMGQTKTEPEPPKVDAEGNLTGGMSFATIPTTITAIHITHEWLLLELVDGPDKNSSGIDKFTVRYQGREVNLTAKEIMEALEGR